MTISGAPGSSPPRPRSGGDADSERPASGASLLLDDDLVHLQGHYYIQATSSRTDDRTRVLKHDETFAVYDRFGDIQPVGLGEQGLYDAGTRFLSRLELRVGGRRPLLLSSTVKKENDLLTVDLTNPDLTQGGVVTLPRGRVHVFRSKFLCRGTSYERMRISNFGMSPITTDVLILFDGDWADIFEVRGMTRLRRGVRGEPVIAGDGRAVTLSYQGLDGVRRRTHLGFDPAPSHLGAGGVRWDLEIAPHQAAELVMTVACVRDGDSPRVTSYDDAFRALGDDLGRDGQGGTACALATSHQACNAWLGQSLADLHMMTTATEHGPFPYAGVPWFSAPFGRDAIITALELLWLRPQIGRGVLRFLAATQAREIIPEQEAEPGKILHEARQGEMAALGEVPFGRYYGSVDATPLFVMLAGAYYDRTADLALVEEIWPNIELAMAWIDGAGDPDGDGFLEYTGARGGGGGAGADAGVAGAGGLVQQGWKDSHDSVFHADGAMAAPPIALVEVQGYAYGARRAAARLSRALGRPQAETDEHERRARWMRARFEEQFWCEDIGTYALALDGGKRPCRVRTSNAGHALYCGIAGRAHARKVARALMDERSFSGFGVRTLATGEVRYNPMSYHNGSVWPHDNAVVAAGLARYGYCEAAGRIFEGLFSASQHVELHRLPELYCGFARRPGEGPTLYPVACAPQAWAAGSVFLLLQAALGITVDAVRKEVALTRSFLPDWLEEVRISALPLGPTAGHGSIDVLFERHPHDVGVTVLRRDSPFRVVVTK
jgi:glycogen debranching enzyme